MSLRILIVDDEPLDLELAQALVEEEGHEAVPVASWAQVSSAIFGADKQRIDLAFIDVKMPGVQGNRLVEIIKKVSTTRKVPLVLVSSLGEDELQSCAMECGADDWVRKPLTAGVVRSLLQRHCAT